MCRFAGASALAETEVASLHSAIMSASYDWQYYTYFIHHQAEGTPNSLFLDFTLWNSIEYHRLECYQIMSCGFALQIRVHPWDLCRRALPFAVSSSGRRFDNLSWNHLYEIVQHACCLCISVDTVYRISRSHFSSSARKAPLIFACSSDQCFLFHS